MKKASTTTDGTVTCSRCGVRLRVNPPPESGARMLRRAKVADGQCVDCATAEWLVVAGLRASVPDPQVLLHPHVRAQFARVMAASRADARPAEIHWDKVVADWALPFRSGRARSPRPRTR